MMISFATGRVRCFKIIRCPNAARRCCACAVLHNCFTFLCISAQRLVGHRRWASSSAQRQCETEDFMTSGNAFVDCMSMSAPVNLAGYGVGADEFRSLAASLPTGVTVVTTTGPGGEPVGMTCGAVCSLSCEPPLLLTC